MSRNEEKHHGVLNRIWLEQLRKDEAARKPKRPRLSELQTAQDIAKWIPSIEEDLNFCLQQSQVPCYTEAKVQEYYDKIEALKNEHKKFRKKLHSFGDKMQDLSGTARPYVKKRHLDSCDALSSPCKIPAFIPTPLLDCESSLQIVPKEPSLAASSHTALATGNWNCIDSSVQNTLLASASISDTRNASHKQPKTLGHQTNKPNLAFSPPVSYKDKRLLDIFGFKGPEIPGTTNQSPHKDTNLLGINYDSD